MDAEHNTIFIKNISEWLGGISSFDELNKRLPEVAAAILQHDTTGMAETFNDISNRLESLIMEIINDNLHEDIYNVLIVTHAFSIKTIFYMFAPEQLNAISKLKTASIARLEYNSKHYVLTPNLKF